MSKSKLKIRCVTLKGELSDWGKHILMPFGVTLCGIPTVDCDKEQFPQLKEKAFADMIFEYKVEEWDITCKRCIEMFDVIESHHEKSKNIN